MADTDILHASCVALGDRAVLIRGASGSGKSSLALELMSRGCTLVADDRTRLHSENGRLIASAPASIRGMIEARGLGLLNAETVDRAEVVLCVDLDRHEKDRLPEIRTTLILGCSIALLWRVEHAHFPAAIRQYLKSGRRA